MATTVAAGGAGGYLGAGYAGVAGYGYPNAYAVGGLPTSFTYESRTLHPVSTALVARGLGYNRLSAYDGAYNGFGSWGAVPVGYGGYSGAGGCMNGVVCGLGARLPFSGWAGHATGVPLLSRAAVLGTGLGISPALGPLAYGNAHGAFYGAPGLGYGLNGLLPYGKFIKKK